MHAVLDDFKIVLDDVKVVKDKFLFDVKGFFQKTNEKTNSKNPHKKLVNSSLITSFNTMTLKQLDKKVKHLSALDLRKLRSYELANQRRRSFLYVITNALNDKVFGKV